MKLKLLFTSIVIIPFVANTESVLLWEAERLSLADKMKQYTVICPALIIMNKWKKEDIRDLAMKCRDHGETDIHSSSRGTACGMFEKYMDDYYKINHYLREYDMPIVTHPGRMKPYIADMKAYFRLKFGNMNWIRNEKNRIFNKLFVDELIRVFSTSIDITKDEVCCGLETLGYAAFEVEKLKKYHDTTISEDELNREFDRVRTEFKNLMGADYRCARENLIMKGYILYFYIELYVHRNFKDIREDFTYGDICKKLGDYLSNAIRYEYREYYDRDGLVVLIDNWPLKTHVDLGEC